MTADLKPGDAVRWWPDGHDDAGQANVDRYIDGTVTALNPTWIKITGHRGFTEWIMGGGWRLPAIGHAVDTSISPGTMQRLNPVPRPYAPGEKMTDRHPDSVIAQVVEETIEKHNLDRVKFLATPIKVRSTYAPLPPVGEPSFPLFEQDGALYVDTEHGPVKVSPAAALNPAFAQPCGIGSTHHTHRCERPAGHKGVHVGRGCSWGEDAVEKLPGGGSSTFSGPYRIGEAEMQAETPRVVTTCPGWNGVFTIEPDPPDLAQRRAARVADHQRREMQERGPFDYDVPSYAGILKAPYEQPARPDGFDQRHVDAAKAALLAPAPPRYKPR